MLKQKTILSTPWLPSKSLKSTFTEQLFHQTQTCELVPFVYIFFKKDNCLKFIIF